MIRRDLKSNVDVVQSIAPQARTATINGSSADLLGYDSAMVVFSIGAFTNGAFTPKVQESDDDSAYSDVAAADLSNALTAVTGAGQQNAVQRVGYKGTKRYIRARIEEGSSPAPATGCLVSATIVRGNPHAAPLA
jgi:hypothetical protein